MLMCGIQKNNIDYPICKAENKRHRYRKQMCRYQGGKEGWGGRNWEIGIDTFTVLILCIR